MQQRSLEAAAIIYFLVLLTEFEGCIFSSFKFSLAEET